MFTNCTMAAGSEAEGEVRVQNADGSVEVQPEEELWDATSSSDVSPTADAPRKIFLGSCLCSCWCTMTVPRTVPSAQDIWQHLAALQGMMATPEQRNSRRDHLCCVLVQEDDRSPASLAAAAPSWVSSEWQASEAGAVQILPHGLDGHQVKEVVGSMRLQHIVLLTDRLQVSSAEAFCREMRPIKSACPPQALNVGHTLDIPFSGLYALEVCGNFCLTMTLTRPYLLSHWVLNSYCIQPAFLSKRGSVDSVPFECRTQTQS